MRRVAWVLPQRLWRSSPCRDSPLQAGLEEDQAGVAEAGWHVLSSGGQQMAMSPCQSHRQAGVPVACC